MSEGNRLRSRGAADPPLDARGIGDDETASAGGRGDSPRESEIIDCGFRPVREILADMEGFESWSQICMKALFG